MAGYTPADLNYALRLLRLEDLLGEPDFLLSAVFLPVLERVATFFGAFLVLAALAVVLPFD